MVADQVRTLPLTAEEYGRLLDAVYVTVKAPTNHVVENQGRDYWHKRVRGLSIREIAQARVRYGYRKIRVLLNREGWDGAKHLVYRLYKEEGLMLKRLKPAGKRKERLKATAPDQVWSMDLSPTSFRTELAFAR